MSDYSTRREQALLACDKVINGIEDGTISVSSSLLLCKKIARLVNDIEGQEWLDCEYSGYTNRFNLSIWDIAEKHRRSYTTINNDGKILSGIFNETCGELEASIESNKKALNNYSTQGFSVSGEWAVGATNHMAYAVTTATNQLLEKIKTDERRLSILKSEYYDYAVRWQIELKFGKAVKTVFEEYQERVDGYFSKLQKTTLQKLNAIEDLMEESNPEHYSQVLTSCRRLWSEIAKTIFYQVLPNYTGKTFKTKSGRVIDISGDNDNNKLSAVIETLQSKASKNTLVGSETVYLIDWIDAINNRQNAGVHHDVTREEATQCILHTYIALGDILTLYKG